jgi:mono/diheme cytochrome c family protein
VRMFATRQGLVGARTFALALGVGFAAAAVVVHAAPVTPPSRAPAPTELREQVRALAKPHCGSCHQASSSTAKSSALAVFDLDEPDWTARLQPRQYDAFLGRIKGKLDEAQLRAVRALIAGSDRPNGQSQ